MTTNTFNKRARAWMLAGIVSTAGLAGLAGQSGALHAAPVLDAHPDAAHIRQTNAWMEIDHKIFESNLAALQKRLNGKTQICAVMKADAYGHSIALLMPSIIRLNIPCVGITSNEEARVAREKGFAGRLLRLRNATPGEIEGALPWNMDELVGSLAVAREMDALAKRTGRAIPIHIALNSGGMARNGLELGVEEGKKDALALVKLPNLKVVGLMTHFAFENREKIQAGVQVFKEETDWLIKEARLNRKDLLLHAANTQTTLEVPEGWFDLVRAGRVIYGEVGPDYPEFKTLMAFKSRVAAVNAYPKGSGVGYDQTRTLTRDSLLANIPVGYSDGYRRVLSNRASVLIHGQRAPMVGRVSMNTFMVDVTDIPGVKAGDEVVLFGKQGSAEITQKELEDVLEVFLAENYTVWSTANPRVLKNPD